MEIKERIDELCEQVWYSIHRYHVLDDPVISDDAYDALYRELQELEAAHPELVTPDSPTQRVGGEIREEFTAVEHPSPMLSLGNAFNPDELRAWRDRFLRLLPEDHPEPAYVVEPKIDGLTVVLHYADGVFTLGATRGDGMRGEDITRQSADDQGAAAARPAALGARVTAQMLAPPAGWSSAARPICPSTPLRRSTGRRRPPGKRPTPTRATRPPAACASWIRPSPPRGP